MANGYSTSMFIPASIAWRSSRCLDDSYMLIVIENDAAQSPKPVEVADI